jgi:hypothetical protein
MVYTLPDLTVIARDPEDAKRVVAQMMATEAVLASMFKRPTLQNSTPTTVILLRSSEWRRFIPGESANELMPQSFATYLLIPQDLADKRLREAASHQATHLFLRSQFTDFMPWWFEEGLAELMQSVDVAGQEAVIGHREYVFEELPRERDASKPTTPTFTNGSNEKVRVKWLPVSRLMRIEPNAPEFKTDEDADAIARESWLLVHRGLVAEPEFGRQMFKYLAAINSLEVAEEAITQSFGMGEKELDRAAFKYSTRSDFQKTTIQFVPPEIPVLGRGLELSDGAAFELIANLMLDSAASTARINEVISAAASRASPEFPDLTVLRMRLAARDRDDALLEKLYHSSAASLLDPAFARGAGLALFARIQAEARVTSLSGSSMVSLCERAFELLNRSLDAKPDDPAAVWAYGMLAASLKRNLDVAALRLAGAAKAMPLNADLSMAKAQVFEASGNKAQMLVELNNTASLSRSLQQRAFVLKRIADARATPVDPTP